MSFQVSARKYRPQGFAEVVGQPHVVRTLCNAIDSGRIAHAYLFSGIRGVGKTTVARIFAKALNCESGPTTTPCNECPTCIQVTAGQAADVLEIDGASTNGVEAVRDLTDNIRYRPLACRYKIYIIDEVHMLSTAAFNALLKTVEEPPEHAVFLFATTETHKIPRTILSRCQHHAFRRVALGEVAEHLAQVAAQQQLDAPAPALRMLARAGDGSLRDALSLFDQAVSFCGEALSEAEVARMLGAVTHGHLATFAGDILARDGAAVLTRLREWTDAGQDVPTLAESLVTHFRNLLVCHVCGNPTDMAQLATLVDLADDDLTSLAAQAHTVPREVIAQVFDLLSDVQERCRRSATPHFLLEAALVRACDAPDLMDLAALLTQWETGDAPAPTSPRAAPVRPAGRPRPAAAPSTPAPVAPATGRPAPPRAMPTPAPAPIPAMTAGAVPVSPTPSAPAPPTAVAPATPAAMPAPDVPTLALDSEVPLEEPATTTSLGFDQPGDTTPPAVDVAEVPPSHIPHTQREPAWDADGSVTPSSVADPTPAEPAPDVVSAEDPHADIPSPNDAPPPAPPIDAAPSIEPEAGVRESDPQWAAVVEAVRKVRPALASYLEHGALVTSGNGTFEVGFLPAYEVMYGMVRRDDAVSLITRLATETTGSNARVLFRLMDESATEVTTLAEEFEAKEAARQRREIEQTMELPFIRDVLDQFGGEIVELRKPDP